MNYTPNVVADNRLHAHTLSFRHPHLFLAKTRIQALLRGLFGKSVDKVKVQHKSFKVKSKTIEISTLGSNYHIEMNPSDVGNSDRHVVQEVIKEIAQTQNVGAGNAAHQFKG